MTSSSSAGRSFGGPAIVTTEHMAESRDIEPRFLPRFDAGISTPEEVR